MLETSPGQPHVLGATVQPHGVNFCIYSANATSLELLLFDRADAATPAQVIALDPATNRTWHYWHVLVLGAKAGQIYGYRADGPASPGLRFDRHKLLADPYALAIVNTENYSRAKASTSGENIAAALKCVVVNPTTYDWEDDAPLRRPFDSAIIYEAHVAGFTRNPNSGVAAPLRGTYAGFEQKIPYLVDLGVQSVELMPVQQFDPQAAPTGVNYWGYQPISWFAPHRPYSSQRDLLAPVNEFRDLVKALHRAGIEVILDVVFNHTAEGNEHGPTLSFRGLDNPTYYLLDHEDRSRYLDDTGCGNTISGNEPIVRRMILDVLRYWVRQMHVDGFRFDLAASLSRGVDGSPLAHPPILLDIEADPVLAGTKIIAEAWDAAGLYEVANFPGDRWAVWNDRFRDNVRRFVKGDSGTVGTLADHLLGSRSQFTPSGCTPCRTINFVTAHDGFTLNDVVTYDEKHNEANGEDNRDGRNQNFSWNCGVEGPTDDAAIETLRRQQLKNFLTILLVAEGRPMLLMGDEVRRTQLGNNNCYCLDDETSWFDWSQVPAHAGLHRFARGLIHLHRRLQIFCDKRNWSKPGSAEVTWHGIKLNQPDWGEDSHALAMELRQPASGEHLHVLLNAWWEPLTFELPPTAPVRVWARLIDTALATPADFSDPPIPIATGDHAYSSQPRSSVVLMAIEPTPTRPTQTKP
jgi:glycogen operon protein